MRQNISDWNCFIRIFLGGQRTSWNRYSYVEGDPVNNIDRTGRIYNACPEGCGEAGRNVGSDGWYTGMPADFSRGFGDYWTLGSEWDLSEWPVQNLQIGKPSGSYRQMSAVLQADFRDKAVNDAIGLLKSKPNCAGLFNVGGENVDPVTLLSNLAANGSYGSLEYTALTGAIAGTTPSIDENGNPLALISLNDNLFGGWATESSLQRAGTILHELGHAYNILFGNGSSVIRQGDNPIAAPNQAAALRAENNQTFNNNAINQNCLQ